MDVQQGDDGQLRELALFAGAGGGILGGKLLGWRTICAVERDAYAAAVLAQRQNDGLLQAFPIWSDVTTFDGTRWRGRVDVISGGFPCQDISSAGKGAGIGGARSGLWSEFARIIGEVRPRFVFVENSPMLTSRGLGRVLGDLASMGYDAEWCVLSAADCGANHERERIWILGYTNSSYESIVACNGEMADMQETPGYAANPDSAQCEGSGVSGRAHQEYTNIGRKGWWETAPDFRRVDDGVAFTMDRLKAIGNGQVPIVAATAFNLLMKRINP